MANLGAFVFHKHIFFCFILFSGDSYKCDICKFFVEQLNEYIKENKTVAEIEHLLEEFCDELPDTISAQVSLQLSILNLYYTIPKSAFENIDQM